MLTKTLMLLAMMQGPAHDPAETALAWVRQLDAGGFDSAAAQIDPSVPAGVMSADRLRLIWGAVTQQYGKLGRLDRGSVATRDTLTLVELVAGFASQPMGVRVVLTPHLKITGFFIHPLETAYQPPAYVDTARFTEREIQVGTDPWLLPGTITVPKGPGPFPVVVLVHGSGPNDRDETIGGNRPFKDLAWGLASRGIAVVRYDKRTRVYGARMQSNFITLDAEVIDDALAALHLARSTTALVASRVFLLGHSLGAMLGPTIAARDGHLAGLILLAGPARRFADVLRDQIRYIDSLSGGADPGTKEILAQLPALTAHTLPPDSVVLGVPAAYWYQLDTLRVTDRARTLKARVLVLQGGRDYQSTMADFALWQRALAGRPNATLKSYPDLNHLFVTGSGKATPQEYQGPGGHVAPAVIDDLVRWIGGAR
ncbi:MAG TPA: alpha/beta fold hydrolase [Gemmatimonadales bacterium]|nr:alpha/beta fold hydrolase [Gemmatimonadales bacterium]